MSGWQSISQPFPPYSATDGLEKASGFGGHGSEAYQTYQAYESAHQVFNNNFGFAHQDFVGQQHVYQGNQGHSNGAVGHQRHQEFRDANGHHGGRAEGRHSHSIGSVQKF